MVKKYFIPAIVLIGVYLAGLSSCSLIDPPVTIPCYGRIDTMDITTNYPVQGSNSSAITCAWVYVDDQPAGAFALPCKFPMIASSGSHLITIFPGVTADGINATREKYPFYSSFNTTVNIKQDSVVTFKYTPTYTSTTQFDWLEDFENNGVTIATYYPESDSVSMAVVAAPYAFQGHSGEVILDSNSQHNQTFYTGVSVDTFFLPTNGTPAFLEFNYNTNNTFGVGVCVNGSPANQLQPLVEVYPTTGWKKMYVDLGPSLNAERYPFYIYFNMQRQPGLAQATLFLDNIKLMYLK